MSVEHSRKLIHDIAATREADDYIEGLLKGAEMWAMAEAAEATGKWDTLTQHTGTIVSDTPQPTQDNEIER